MRRWLFIFGLLLILIVLIALDRALSGWHYVVDGEGQGVLYAESFDTNDGWTEAEGRLAAHVRVGGLHLEVREAQKFVFSVAPPRFADFDLQATARALEGPEDNGFGVIFRLQNQDNTRIEDDSFYLFLISSDGFYSVERRVNGQPRILSNWIPSDAINTGLGAENHIGVSARGDQFQFRVNGQLMPLCIPNDLEAQSTPLADGTCLDGQMLDTLTDASLLEGQLGGVAQAGFSDNIGVVVMFDDVIVEGAGEQQPDAL